MSDPSYKLTIDDKVVDFIPGHTILQIAEVNGIYIPNLCYIEGLTPYGGCRLCIVKVKGMKGFPTACSTPAQPDMQVITRDEELQELRREVMKLILSEHPYSCLVCNNKEQCESVRFSKIKSGRKFGCFSCSNKEICGVRKIVNFIELDDVPYELRYKNIPLYRDDPFIEQDYNLCIMCGRCVRVCNELRGNGAINFLYRGSDARVSTAYDLLHLDPNCQFCGACVDICPTGALSSKNMKWVKKTDNFTTSICGFCSVGCGFDYFTIEDTLMDSIPNKQNPVNKGQACVIGRFCTASFINSSGRLQHPLVRRHGELVPCEWEEAYSTIVENLKKYNPDEIAVITSRDLSNESAYLLNKFATQVLKTPNITTVYDGDPIHSFYELVKQQFNAPFLHRSFQKISESRWILLFNTSIEDTHPMLQVYLKQAKDQGTTILSLSIGDSGFSPTIKRLIDHEVKLSKENLLAFLVLMVRTLIELNDKATTPISNLNQLNQIFDKLIIPKEVLEYKSVLSALLDNNNGSILFSHRVPLPEDYTRDIIGLLLNLIILSNYRSQLIPLWRRGNTEGVYSTNSYNNLDANTIFKAVKSGKIKTLYLTERLPDTKILQHAKFVVIQDIFPSANLEFADVVLPTCAFIEDSGTLLNSEIRLQRFFKSASPIGNSKPDWQIICELSSRLNHTMGALFQFDDVNAIFEEILETNPHLKALTYLEAIPKLTSPPLYIPKLNHSAFKLSYETDGLQSFNYRGEYIANHVTDLNGIINYRNLKKTGPLNLVEDDIEKKGFKIIKNEEIVPNMYELILEAPLIAKKAKPGNFILIMRNEYSERLPMTLSNWDDQDGTITIYYQESGFSTKELTEAKSGSYIYSVVGPLGNDIKIDHFGTVLLGGGCYGIGATYPIMKEAKRQGNKVIVILEARNKILLYLEKEFEALADRVIYCTSDGSKGIKGKIQDAIQHVLKEDSKIDWAYFIGCKPMMWDASRATKDAGSIPTFVSLNTIMIDGTGMCGGCRLTLLQDGKEITKFACIDGPSFNGHLINWDELINRGTQFANDEVFVYQDHVCKMLEKYRTENP